MKSHWTHRKPIALAIVLLTVWLVFAFIDSRFGSGRAETVLTALLTLGVILIAVACMMFSAITCKMESLKREMNELVLPKQVKKRSLRMLRAKLVKIGARVVRHSRYVVFQMTEVAVPKALFREILDRIGSQDGWYNLFHRIIGVRDDMQTRFLITIKPQNNIKKKKRINEESH